MHLIFTLFQHDVNGISKHRTARHLECKAADFRHRLGSIAATDGVSTGKGLMIKPYLGISSAAHIWYDSIHFPIEGERREFVYELSLSGLDTAVIAFLMCKRSNHYRLKIRSLTGYSGLNLNHSVAFTLASKRTIL